jgi:elongation factor P
MTPPAKSKFLSDMSSIVRANDLRKGKFVDYNGEVCEVVTWEFHRQGRGGSTIKMVFEGLDSGSRKIVDCSVDEKFSTVDVSEKIIQYMYDDGDGFYCAESCYYPYHKLDKALIPLLGSGLELRIIYIDDEIKTICLP